jgi:YggT family protein
MRVLADLINLIVQIYAFLFIARALLSFTGIDPYHPAAQFLYRLTEPVLAPIRRVLPPAGMMDFSPMVAMLLVIVVGQILVALLTG